jgi:CheY-like chemotaxis protein
VAERQRRVLVVNDEARLAESVRQLLSNDGYEARVALDGFAALELLAQTPADLILLDLIMPRLDGWSFLKHRAADPLLLGVPVLFWSVADRDAFEEAQRLGATRCLSRAETTPDQLLESIARLMGSVEPSSTSVAPRTDRLAFPARRSSPDTGSVLP